MKALYDYFGNRLVNQTEIPFWANSVDIQTGRELIMRTGTLAKCVRSSCSLPGLFSPLPSDLNLLVDGLIVDPIPVKLVHEMGCHFSVAINTMAVVKPQKIKRRYPFNILDLVIRSFFMIGHEIGQARATQAADVVFTPNMGEIGPVDFSSSRELIECGRKAAEENLPAILASYESLKTTW